MTSVEVHDLAGAYALDALDDLERVRFERHVLACPACGTEARELVETASRLGAAAAVPPPPELRSRVLSEVDVTRQVAPVGHARAPRGRTRWAAFGLPAVAAALAVTVTLVTVGALTRRDAGLPAGAAEVLAAADARTVQLEAGEGVTGSVTAAPSTDGAVLAVDGLAPLDGDAAYVLWTIRGGVPRNEGTVAAGDDPVLIVLTDTAEVAEIAVTLEPRADVSAPIGPFVARAALVSQGMPPEGKP